MAEEHRIVLIPALPEDEALDFVFKTERGVAVQVSDEQIQALKNKGIPVVLLYNSGNEYAGAMLNLPKEEALAAIESLTDTRLAALSTEDRDKFGVA